MIPAPHASEILIAVGVSSPDGSRLETVPDRQERGGRCMRAPGGPGGFVSPWESLRPIGYPLARSRPCPLALSPRSLPILVSASTLFTSVDTRNRNWVYPDNAPLFVAEKAPLGAATAECRTAGVRGERRALFPGRENGSVDREVGCAPGADPQAGSGRLRAVPRQRHAPDRPFKRQPRRTRAADPRPKPPFR